MQKLLKENHAENFYTEEHRELVEKLAAEVQTSPYVPKYHIYPKAGLMNDPNGLAYFNGKYHVFFQWYPFAPVHGLKHWGLTTSTDLVHWSEQEMALIPNQEFEKNGCYSGNAIEHQGQLYLFYTANYKTPAGKIPKQAVAVMNAQGEITKMAEPIIPAGIEGLSGELRDPFVFRKNDTFYMLLGGSQFEGEAHSGFGDKGVLLLYQSDDLLNWHYLGLVDVPIETGYMLECPSLIEVDGKEILLLSPMGFAKENNRFQNRFASIYLVGNLDIEAMRFDVEQWDEMDAGFDFYAPQAFRGAAQEPLMFGWFGCGEPTYPGNEQWKHGLTFPQKLTLENEVFKRYPAAEIVAAMPEAQVVETTELPVITATYRLALISGFNFTVGTAADYWTFTYDEATQKATISRADLAQEIDADYGFERSTFIKGLTLVEVFVDHSFIEIYLNQGEKVFSFTVFQPNEVVVKSLAEPLQGTLYQ